MRDYLSRTARFEKYDGRAKAMVAADPPHDLAKIVLARDGDWKFLPLTEIITTPSCDLTAASCPHPATTPRPDCC